MYVLYGMGHSAIKAQLADLLFKEHCANVAICERNQSFSQVTVSRPMETGCFIESETGRVIAVDSAGSVFDPWLDLGVTEPSLSEGRPSNATITCK